MGEVFLLSRSGGSGGESFKGLIDVPVTEEFVYTGTEITPTWTNYEPDKMTIGGVYSGTNAGTYYATFTPKQGYYWNEEDGDDNVRVISWTINKAAGSLSLSAESITLDLNTTTTTVTVTRAGNGAISAVSNNTSVATVSVSGTTLTISGVNDTMGEAVITVSVAEGTNYTAPVSKTIAVTASFIPAVGTALNDCSWGVISKIAEAGLASSYFEVGDRKSVHVNGTVGTLAMDDTLYVYIIGFNHNGATNTIDFGTFKTALSNGKEVCPIDSEYWDGNTNGTKYFNMNHWGRANYGGWKGCDLRYDVLGSTDVQPSGYGAIASNGRTGYDATATCATNPVANTMMAALPSELRAVMKPMTIYTDNTGGGSDTASYVTASVDYLPLLAEYEIFGSRSDTYSNYFSANSAEKNYQTQYTYYAAGNPWEKYRYGNSAAIADWWERSVSIPSDSEWLGGFCHLWSEDDEVSYPSHYWADYSFALSPIFRV